MSFLAAQETVRPDPGLARGVFATTPLFFYALLAVTVVGLALWLGRHRLQALVRRKPS